MTKLDVDSQIVREHGLVGTFFYPADLRSYPAIILLSGSSGKLRERDAALLAAEGYCVLALAYFGYGQLPPRLTEVPLEYFETAIFWLQSQPVVLAEKIGVLGTSKGGEAALLLGATFPAIKAVVSYASSSVAHQGLGLHAGEEPKSSWTYQGQPVPFLPYEPSPASLEYLEVCKENHLPQAFRPLYLESMQDKAGVEQATIPVEKINGPILLISGQDDQMWPSDVFGELVEQRLKACNHPFPHEHLCYPDAGHKIGFPPVDRAVLCQAVHPVSGVLCAYGGTPQGNKKASEHSWQKLLTFLSASFYVSCS